MPEPAPHDDGGDVPFYLSPWPFLEPRYPDGAWVDETEEP
jgi:hypothetical protein